MEYLLEFFVILFVIVLPSIYGSLFFRKSILAKENYSNIENMLLNWAYGGSYIAILLYIAIRQPNGVASIGIIFPTTIEVIFFGLIIGAALVISVVVILKLLKKKGIEIFSTEAQEFGSLISRYRNFTERSSYFITSIYLIIGEDLFSRGYLILLMPSRTGMLPFWICISIIFSVITHLYQGRKIRVILYHIVLSAFFITLTLLTKNIFYTIAAHIYFDLVIFRSQWVKFDLQDKDKSLIILSRQEKFFFFFFILGNILLFCIGLTYLGM